VKISAIPIDIFIVQVYVPTTDHGDYDIDNIYDEISEILIKKKYIELMP
jgi:hypothetical protein